MRRGQKGGGEQALGRSQGGFRTKLPLRAERGGKPIVWTLTPGQRHETTQVPALLEQGAVRQRSGRSRIRPYWRRRGIGTVIPRQRKESRRGGRFDRTADRERTRGERLINRLKQHRAIATR